MSHVTDRIHLFRLDGAIEANRENLEKLTSRQAGAVPAEGSREQSGWQNPEIPGTCLNPKNEQKAVRAHKICWFCKFSFMRIQNRFK